jgi:hypothetical protein
MSALEGKADFPAACSGLLSLTRSGSCKTTFYIYNISHEDCNRHSNAPLSHMVHLSVHLLRYLHQCVCLRLPLGQLLQNLLKLLGRVVLTTRRSCRAYLRANICEEGGEKAASNLVEVGVGNSSSSG